VKRTSAIFLILLILPLALAVSYQPAQAEWYWKPDQPPHAPSGMPDFDQNQNGWNGYCGPTSAADCLWWFGPALTGAFPTPPLLIAHLAELFGTNESGDTEPQVMAMGLNLYFQELEAGYRATLFKKPDFFAMEDSLKKSQDVILTFLFWYKDETGWHTNGGHWVTMAGVYSEAKQVAVSDPDNDNAVVGAPGRFRPPTHPAPGTYTAELHNNPEYVSHDAYSAVDPPPDFPPNIGSWELENYVTLEMDLSKYTGRNIPPELMMYYTPVIPPKGTVYHCVVDYAVMVCPGIPLVPSLTNWGLLILLALLILSGIYVVYQRRKGVARA
jgi:hypothetical protein